jgi:UDP-N-acetylmuramoylalanine--D-glutamate ligase
MKQATIIGLGRSGIAAAKLLMKEGYAVTISDRGNNENLQALQSDAEALDIKVKLGDNFTPDRSMDTIVVSPGVPWDAAALKQAREMNIDTIGEMELAWRYGNSVPWIGITGTNGKTTTTALIAAIFQTAGSNAPACGNIGYAATEIVAKDPLPDWIIAELSSYQIESSATLAPQIAIWTTFTPDHLNRHYNLENYYDIKASVLKRAKHQIFNGDDPYLFGRASEWPSAIWTSIKGKQYLPETGREGIYIEDNWIVFKKEKVAEVSTIKMPGSHNLQNILVAIAAAKIAGIDNKSIQKTIADFGGVPHRLETVRTWQGIDFINDSKATNYDAAEVGLNAVKTPAILIAGGEIKEGDDRAWIASIQSRAAFVFLIGDAAAQFATRLTQVGYNDYEVVDTMANAVTRSSQLAPKLGAKVVLLSPACASFDRYRSFEHRGEDFRQLCQQLMVDG